jgi:hypothetical protein
MTDVESVMASSRGDWLGGEPEVTVCYCDLRTNHHPAGEKQTDQPTNQRSLQ